MGVSSETKGRSKVQVRSTDKKVFTVWTRKWEISSAQNVGFKSIFRPFFFLPKNSFGLCCPPRAPFWMIYWARVRDNAHTTNLSAEHIDTWVCHYRLIMLLTYVSIQDSWQFSKPVKWPQINPQHCRALPAEAHDPGRGDQRYWRLRHKLECDTYFHLFLQHSARKPGCYRRCWLKGQYYVFFSHMLQLCNTIKRLCYLQML